MEKQAKTLVVIAGPTAVGKTRSAIMLAQHFQTQIVSADSRQIYRELNIGTAKPSTDELEQVKHHFINSHAIHDDYDAAQYGDDALAAIEKLFKQNDFVVLCGGSGLYIKAVCEGFDDIPEIDPSIREALIKNFELNGLSWLQQRLQEEDLEYFNKIDQKNPHRLIRGLEVKMGTGSSILSFQKKEKRQLDFNVVKIGLELPREILYQRIDERMDNMIDAGLFEEAKSLYPLKHLNALQTVGYQEIFDFLDDLYDKDEAIRLLKRNSRRYAKRQLTWFKRDEEFKWFHPENTSEMIAYIEHQHKS